MTDKNRELVPDNWSLVRERALTTGLCSEGRYSEHSGVCRRVELPGRSEEVLKGVLIRNYLKANMSQSFRYYWKQVCNEAQNFLCNYLLVFVHTCNIFFPLPFTQYACNFFFRIGILGFYYYFMRLYNKDLKIIILIKVFLMCKILSLQTILSAPPPPTHTHKEAPAHTSILTIQS